MIDDVSCTPRWVASTLLATGAAAWLAAAPIAVADPVDPEAGSESARAVIDDLRGQGYNVEINWVSGVSSIPLSSCAVTGINNPDQSAGPPTTFTTVYVDVSCPNHDDSGLVLGGGLGIGPP
jgi:hypothetical protein